MSDLTDYMRMICNIRSAPPEGWLYKGAHDFVLQRGRPFEYAPLPASVEPGEPKMCYQTAFNLAMDRADLTYVEGYGLRLIPTEHAWCVTSAGVVVDPTWLPPDEGDDEPREYFGIPFRLDFVTRTIFKAEVYGVIHLGGMIHKPLMRGEVPEAEWLETGIDPTR